jgi:ubiquinone/menaquinone biosynthesis C-methylase UbiE
VEGHMIDLKQRQRQAWQAGDYRTIGATLQIVSETLCEAVDLRGGEAVLDVATGTGNTAIAAARRWCDVTAIDYVPSLLELARVRAAAEGLPVTFLEGDAEKIPLSDSSFDAVLSTFGAVFATNHEKTANELVRVCRVGGKIGMANWTPSGFIGTVFRTISQMVPPPEGVRPPILWGTEAHLHQLFGDRVTLRVNKRHLMVRFLSPGHWIEVLSTTFGPLLKAFEVLDDSDRERLVSDKVASAFNQADDGTLVAPSEYLELVATKA